MKEELTRQIESLYVQARAGKDPDTGELHITPTEFYERVISIIAQRESALLSRVALIIGEDDVPEAPMHTDMTYWRTRNELRTEVRTKLDQLSKGLKSED